MNAGRVDINQVLMQMRSIKAQLPSAQVNHANVVNQANEVKQIGQVLQPTQSVEANEPPSFGEMFKSAIDTVNHHQQESSKLSDRYEKGDPSVDLPEVMIALQKSSISFQAMTQVRNKMVEAYKDIMNMPL